MYVPRQQRLLECYLKEIGQISLLKEEEEVDLARRIKKGDTDALHALVRSNLRFVVSVAKKYQGQGLSLSDLINEGNYGLLKAAGRFDETRGFKFISYAVWWVRQSILHALAEQSRVVRLPQNRIGTISKIRKTSARLSQDLKRAPTVDELAAALGIEPQKVNDALRHTLRHVSIDAPLGEDDSSSLLDLLEGSDSTPPDDVLLGESIRMDVERALVSLPPRDAEITRLYFGIGHAQPMNLEEIGRQLGLTRERVRQIKEKALRRLRQKHHRDGLKVHV